MTTLHSPILSARLIINLSIFLGKLAWHLYPTLILGSLALVLALINSFQAPSPRQNISKPENTVNMREKKLESLLEEQLRLLETQPTHRDILYNLSQLYQELGQEETASLYLEKARHQDPNTSLFGE